MSPRFPGDEEDDALMALAPQSFAREPAQPPIQLPAPPMRGEPEAGPAIAAGVLDVLLNNGRNVPQLFSQFTQGSNEDREIENWKRTKDHAVTQQRLNTPIGGAGRSMSPESFALQQARLGLSKQRYADSHDKMALEQKQREALLQMDSPETLAERTAAVVSGLSQAEADRMNGTTLRAWRNQLGQRAGREDTDKRIRGRMEYGDELSRGRTEHAIGLQEGKQMRGEEREETRVNERRGQDFAEKWAQRNETNLDIAGLIQDIESAPGGVPPDFFERFSSSITARGIAPERLESWQAKHLVLELWSRGQSGAAISGTEDEKFKLQAGIAPTASSEQVEAAYNVLSRLTARRLRGSAAGNRAAAREVADGYGLQLDRWMGPDSAQGPMAPNRERAGGQRQAPARTPIGSTVDPEEGGWEDLR